MKAIHKNDVIFWLILIGLTLFGYFLSESSLNRTTLILFLLLATALKFAGVGFQFMDIKKGHIFWKMALFGFLFLYTIIVLTLT